jgi:hypothetical protein
LVCIRMNDIDYTLNLIFTNAICGALAFDPAMELANSRHGLG